MLFILINYLSSIYSDPKVCHYELLRKQHDAFLGAIKSCGLEVTLLDPLADYPAAYFVEDTAVVTPDVAIITNPGAKARRGEEEFMAPVLAAFRKTESILVPGTVDGGDILQIENHYAKTIRLIFFSANVERVN